ncbi:SpoIIE family protein phosphatase [Prevotella sp. P6B4]|uniref:SpoIIE family protein phosphatase n=1 Tax=Prevotella sp. P6B4 TaxID=1410614 RepID=UPI000491B54E|nr:SpoIIE family protein phosphatase [Prevotella sp. P6B4]
MRQTKHWIFLTMIIALLLTACGEEQQKGQISEADKLIEATQKTRKYTELLQVVDSLETIGSITSTKACYWRGYAYDKMKHQRLAEYYWKASLNAAAESTDPDEMTYYARSASRLANMLSVRGNYEEGLNISIPVVQKLESLDCDSTSDYLNILIYIGCCQEGLGTNEGNAEGFNKAYQRHMENIETYHNDLVYKDGITGLINITYNYIYAKKWQEALNWITRFGQVLSEYEQRLDADADYIDRQLARYDIYQAIALEGLGRSEEAAKAYEKFLTTQFSNTPKGRIDANDYLTTAHRWDEAAENYSSLNAMMGETPQNYSLENIESLVLKKYRTNLLAGRRDSAIQVAMDISNALGQAITKSKNIEKEELAVIVDNVEKMTEQEAQKNRKYQTLIVIGFVCLILCMTAFMVVRHRKAKQMEAQYEDLRYDYDRLEADTIVKEREDSELRIGQNIQQVMPPSLMPKHKHFDMWSAVKLGQIQGGGVMDFCLRNGKLFFCVGEATVEGVKASLLTTLVKAQFRTAAAFEPRPEKIMMAINSALAKNDEQGVGVRLFVGVLDINNGVLYFCNANHSAPLLVSNELHHLPVEQNVPIGERPNWKFEAQETTLLPGTMLFLNTDGLIKVKNAEHRVFNEKRMLGSALQAMKLDPRPKPFIDNMLDAVQHFAGDYEQRDDMSLLAIRYKGGAKLEQKADEEPEPETEVEPEVQPVVEPQQPEPEVFEAPQPIEEPKVYDEPEFYDEPEITIEDAEATEIL